MLFNLDVDHAPKPVLFRYGAAILFIVLVLLARIAIRPLAGDESPYLAFFVAVALSAWYGGFGPGVLATAGSAAAAIFIVAGPESPPSPAHYVNMILFLGQGLVVSYLCDVVKRSRRRMAEVLESVSDEAKDKVERMSVELEQRVDERTAQMNSTIRELEAFSYSISHDLRAPLRAIDGFSKLLYDDYHEKLDDEGRRLIEIIRNNTLNMGRLIDGLLAFSRLGRQQMDHSPVVMSDVVKDAIEEVRHSLDGRNVEFRISRDLPNAEGDRVLLRQVLINLLSNSVKFSRDRNPAIIEIGTKSDQDKNTFFVRDNGVGFDSRYADKMFGVFQRLHAATEFEGSGLGLAIVQRIVNRHGGRVWAEGTPGAGATVYFSLPKLSGK